MSSKAVYKDSSQPLAVEVSDLVVQFGNFKAVNHISFNVPRSQIFGFLGANGAGKTTTIRVLCGLLLPTSGFVKVAGIGFDQGERLIKSKVGYMSQRFTLYNDLSVAENLEFACALRKLEPDYFLIRRKYLLDLIAFDQPLDAKVISLSGGTKQQVSLVAALLHDPEIVFLDEPTAGVTPVARYRFWNLIRQIALLGKTVFVTTHYMDEAEQCERVALMKTGELIALDSPAALKATAFPEPVFELEPIEMLDVNNVLQLRNSGMFSFFEPYGLRFHASLQSGQSGQSGQPGKSVNPPNSDEKLNEMNRLLKNRFKVRQIQPSLEDVFIKAVQG